jgi:hypothetical protein
MAADQALALAEASIGNRNVRLNRPNDISEGGSVLVGVRR